MKQSSDRLCFQPNPIIGAFSAVDSKNHEVHKLTIDKKSMKETWQRYSIKWYGGDMAPKNNIWFNENSFIFCQIE